MFLDVIPFERLVFTWGSPYDPVEGTPVVTLTLTAQGERTEMIFHLRGFAGHPGDQYVYDGWSGTLDNLATHLRDQ
ncbi:SRPBCC family protein [Brevibacillus agri]|uniref:SRPBCC family protein n=1 Tax=Brevibacillus agri TaxID=51101 RepID=UPI00286804DD|nr:SRPBCC domain-containing protein [Brevibacillus agri]